MMHFRPHQGKEFVGFEVSLRLVVSSAMYYRCSQCLLLMSLHTVESCRSVPGTASLDAMGCAHEEERKDIRDCARLTAPPGSDL